MKSRAIKLPESHATAEEIAASYLLRAFRGRVDLAELVGDSRSQGFEHALESVRNLIYRGELSAAEARLIELKPGKDEERAACLLEKMRIEANRGRFVAVLSHSQELLAIAAVPPQIRMTAHQIRGHALILLGCPQDAIGDLKKATALAELFPEAGSAISSYAFLVQAHAQLGQRSAAGEVLAALRKTVLALEPLELRLDRQLTLSRAEAHFARSFGLVLECRVALEEGVALARWLADGVTEAKCTRELAELAPGDTRGAICFPDWAFLPGKACVLWFRPKKAHSLEGKPVMIQMLNALADGPLSSADLFERVWKVSFKRERYDGHLRVLLSKLRKLLPPGSVRVEGGEVRLV